MLFVGRLVTGLLGVSFTGAKTVSTGFAPNVVVVQEGPPLFGTRSGHPPSSVRSQSVTDVV